MLTNTIKLIYFILLKYKIWIRKLLFILILAITLLTVSLLNLVSLNQPRTLLPAKVEKHVRTGILMNETSASMSNNTHNSDMGKEDQFSEEKGLAVGLESAELSKTEVEVLPILNETIISNNTNDSNNLDLAVAGKDDITDNIPSPIIERNSTISLLLEDSTIESFIATGSSSSIIEVENVLVQSLEEKSLNITETPFEEIDVTSIK